MNNQATLVGLFKRTFGDNIIDLFKAQAPLLEDIVFKEGFGDQYSQPLDLQMESAITYAPIATLPSGTAVPGRYIDPSAGQTANALVDGFAIHGRAGVSYTAMAAAASKGQRAFEAAAGRVVKRLGFAHVKRQEINLLHGRRGLGVIATIGSVAGSGPYTQTAVITPGTWSEGLWAGLVGAPGTPVRGAFIDFWNAALSARVNTTEGVSLVGIDTNSRTLTFQSATNTVGVNLIAAGQNIFFEGASPTNESPGLDFWTRLGNAAAGGFVGTFFNVATTEPLFQGNVYNLSSGTWSFAKLIDSLSPLTSYGVMGMKVRQLLSPRAFNLLATDQASLRRYNASEKTAKNGFGALEFNAQTGLLEVLAHPYQKDGLMHSYISDDLKRIGAQEMQFIQRHGDEERLILESAQSPSGEMRTLSIWTLLCEQPRHLVVADGLTY